MPKTNRKLRVGISQILHNELDYDLVRRILEFGHHEADWHFVGIGSTPFVDLAKLEKYRLDGLIGRIEQAGELTAVIDSGIPTVNLAPVESDLPRANHDSRAIGRVGAEYLLGRGFPHYAFFCEAGELAGRLRWEGFSAAVAKSGRPCYLREHNPPEVLPVEWIPVWLEELPGPIAIMCDQDYLARLT
ncbi:MAG: hypothetical protein R3336_03905, partial [Phycisphaeraceae bacterium]|nr:hypothetical protein [Phycisphaeraceae bacterium]